MRTAILRGLRPTTLLLDKQPYSKWNDLDRLLLQAFQMYSDEISTDTGLPFWVGRSPDPEIGFMVEEVEDRASAEIEEWDAKHSGDKKKKGVSRFAVPIDADGRPLDYGGLTRLVFNRAAIQEQQDRDDGIDIERDRPAGGYDPADYGDGVTDPA